MSSAERALPQLTLLNPGPVNVHHDVRAALNQPDVCHREPEVAELIRRVREKAARVTTEASGYTSVVLTGSGTSAMEAVVASVVRDEESILVIENGNYGRRLFDIATANGLAVVPYVVAWGSPIVLEDVAELLQQHPTIRYVALVHNETSSGMLNDVHGVGALAKQHGATLIVDAISSLGCEKLELVDDNIEWCIGTSNKCLEGLPGVSFVVASHASFEALADVPPKSYYLNLFGHFNSQEHLGAPLFTPAVQTLASFEVALDRMLSEGVAARRERYLHLTEIVRSGMREREISTLLVGQDLSCCVTCFVLPSGWTYQWLHDQLRAQGIVIYGTQAEYGHVFRIATMGQLVQEDIERLFVGIDIARSQEVLQRA